MQLLDLLSTHRLLAIVRGTDTEAALDCVLALVDEGLTLVEVSLTTPGALSIIERARAALGEAATLGAGTIVTVADARSAADAGATFLVTPGASPESTAIKEAGLPVIEGALTPTEILAATEGGAAAVKVFPAALGGPGYIKALRDPLPRVGMVAVGGVDVDNAAAFLAAGAVAVGPGSSLMGDAPHGGDLDALRRRASAFRAAVAP
ncbi:bifunctional 4-hydroxy-2-oxoglutarate aldolase/2-dehydro-3-deoxy-phosphogluconate aldolase [Phytohabitans kaempferiae]|uniref:Bifunctional 4-hydroxy-2-oxoglutarate aldolase/2-dehydro-3-deoxy-phosphogluconate aldolase n=1 Tax=Phytohabitans kaempferiae TaxID=1620943 RepID=A0ABV6M493_9ACTN